MLNLPGQDEESTGAGAAARSPAHALMSEQQRQRLSRRRARSGERIHGWADVRKMPGDKYHVDLNMTAHLNWDEWQHMCEEEPMHTQEATWCVLSEEGHGEAADEEGSQAQRQHGEDAPRNPRDDAQRNETSGVPSSARFIRRRSLSPGHAEAPPVTPMQSRGG